MVSIFSVSGREADSMGSTIHTYTFHEVNWTQILSRFMQRSRLNLIAWARYAKMHSSDIPPNAVNVAPRVPAHWKLLNNFFLLSKLTFFLVFFYSQTSPLGFLMEITNGFTGQEKQFSLDYPAAIWKLSITCYAHIFCPLPFRDDSVAGHCLKLETSWW